MKHTHLVAQQVADEVLVLPDGRGGLGRGRAAVPEPDHAGVVARGEQALLGAEMPVVCVMIFNFVFFSAGGGARVKDFLCLFKKKNILRMMMGITGRQTRQTIPMDVRTYIRTYMALMASSCALGRAQASAPLSTSWARRDLCINLFKDSNKGMGPFIYPCAKPCQYSHRRMSCA